jgi:hypothetical protein
MRLQYRYMYHTGHRKPTTAEAAEIEEWPSSRDAWFIHPQAWRQKYYRIRHAYSGLVE